MTENWPPEAPELRGFRGPHIAVDVALLTVAPRPDRDGELRLAALVHRRRDGLAAGEWALPGRMVRERERLADAVRIALLEKCGIEGLAPAQLFVADDPARDNRGWVMSVAHIATQSWDVLGDAIARRSPELALAWIRPKPFSVTLPDKQTHLPFEQDDILARAVSELRERYKRDVDPGMLLPDSDGFTVLQLREVHEAVLGRRLDKDLFRRKFIDQLEPMDSWSSSGRGRPAQVFRRKRRGTSSSWG